MARRIVDSTRYSALRKCPRYRYWLTEHDGRGIIPTTVNEHQEYGKALHAGIEYLILHPEWKLSEVYRMTAPPLLAHNFGVTPDGLEVAKEYLSLLYGHLHCFKEYGLVKFLTKYDIEVGNVEKELAIPLFQDQNVEIVWATRPDIIPRRKSDGMRFNINIKTSQYPDELGEENEHSIQLMMEAEATRLSTGQHISGSLILGFDKGKKQAVSESDKKKGLRGKRLISPLTYCYTKGGHYDHKYTTGWSRTPVWRDPGCENWMKALPPDVKMSRIVEVPIYHDPNLIAAVKQQIVAEELRIMEYWNESGDMNQIFPQNLNNCNRDGGYFHHKCPYKEPCFEDFVDLGGAYKYRDANHPIEDIGEEGE